MKTAIVLPVLPFLFSAFTAFAQGSSPEEKTAPAVTMEEKGKSLPAVTPDALLGQYEGSYSNSADNFPSGVGMKITSVVGEEVKGVMLLYQRVNCGGNLPMHGVRRGNTLELEVPPPAVYGCPARKLKLEIEGNTLRGKLLGITGNWVNIRVSK